MGKKETIPADHLLSLEDGDSGAAALPNETLVSRFEQVAASHPDHVAVVCGESHLTYAELNAQANRLAVLLHARKISAQGEASFVALYLNRSADLLVSMLGILKAGCAYLPIEATYPAQRVMETLDDARPIAIVTSTALSGTLRGLAHHPSIEIIDVEALKTAAMARDCGNPQIKIAAHDLAYLMYTSGSTGKPKGVMVTHRNVVRLVERTQPWFKFGPDDVWTLFHSIAFDFSVWEIWGCWLTGGRLVIVPDLVCRSPRDFHGLLRREQVTVLNQTPSAFLMFLVYEETSGARLVDLQHVIFGGEALQYRSLMPWFQRYGDVTPRVVNMYGITETTVHVTYRVVTMLEAESTRESLIGVPIRDLHLHLLDELGNPVASGEVGEIYVGGEGVTRGYHNRPDLTRERFIPDKFSTCEGGRLYRTGDLASTRADGEMVYLGRNDGQVKISGYRIELGEVEAAIAECPGIRQCCVRATSARDGSLRLSAYYTASLPHVTAATVSSFLALRLPAHMRPSLYTQLQSFPLTANGKIEYAALPAAGLEVLSNSPVERLMSSSTAVESQIAAIWSKVLSTPFPGLDDNFFDVGGTSLLLIRIHGLLESATARRLPVTWMFEHPTVRSLARRLTAPVSPSQHPTTRIQEQATRQREAFQRLSRTRRPAQ